MSDIVIQVENLSKQYRLGEVSTGSLGHDLNRWWHRVRGKEDPYLKVTQTNIREERGTTEYTEGHRKGKGRGANSAFSSDYVWALKDINFEVSRGEVLGIIGRNGAGKSTLLKIMSRITAPTTGEIRVKGRIASLLEVGTGFNPELTGRENIFLNGAILGMTKQEIASKLEEIVDFSGCAAYLDTPVKRYSSGMVVRLGFSVAAHLEPEILIVDEVLAVGDAEFQKKCIGKMKDVASHGRTVLFVSHNMASIETLTERCVILEQGTVSYTGKTDTAIERYCEISNVHTLLGPRVPVKRKEADACYNPDPRIHIQEIGICPGSSSSIPCGGTLALDLVLQATSKITDVCFGYSVRDNLGNNILNGYSDVFSIQNAGDFPCKLMLNRLNLAPGNYQLCLSLNRGGLLDPKYLYEVLLSIGSFRVEPRILSGELIYDWQSSWGCIVHNSSTLLM